MVMEAFVFQRCWRVRAARCVARASGSITRCPQDDLVEVVAVSVPLLYDSEAGWAADQRLDIWCGKQLLLVAVIPRCAIQVTVAGEVECYAWVRSTATMANQPAGAHVLIVGGVSVNDPGGHDKYPYNFINSAARRAIAFRGNAHVLLYAPSYTIRVRKQKSEHRSVQITLVDECALPLRLDICPNLFVTKVKNPHHFLDVLRGSGSKNGFAVATISGADDLTAALNGFESIETVHYFGHSNKTLMFLQYSTTGQLPAVGEVIWGKDQAANVKASQFTSTATFATYGCNQGEVGGLAESLRELWRIRTIGSQGKTDFDTIGQGMTFPKSTGGYYEYPTPTQTGDGKSWITPPRRLLKEPF
jgi:hypothetical protein